MRTLTGAFAVVLAMTAASSAQPGADDPYFAPPSAAPVAAPAPSSSPALERRTQANATESPWGGSVRFTGMSGIGALPGVNYGAELAAYVRRDEWFGELGFGWWRPEKRTMVTQGPDLVELKLDVWTLRAGRASMSTPLRAWLLVEAGELAGGEERGMPGVMARMVTGSTPSERRWEAMGAGFGVAWGMANSARLFGMIEFAVPVNRDNLMLDGNGGAYQPDPLVARSSIGIELGWR